MVIRNRIRKCVYYSELIPLSEPFRIVSAHRNYLMACLGNTVSGEGESI